MIVDSGLIVPKILASTEHAKLTTVRFASSRDLQFVTVAKVDFSCLMDFVKAQPASPASNSTSTPMSVKTRSAKLTYAPSVRQAESKSATAVRMISGSRSRTHVLMRHAQIQPVDCATQLGLRSVMFAKVTTSGSTLRLAGARFVPRDLSGTISSKIARTLLASYRIALTARYLE